MNKLEELKNETDLLANSFTAFREANEQRLSEIAKKNINDPLYEEKIAKINNEINSINGRLEKLAKTSEAVSKIEIAMNRPEIPIHQGKSMISEHNEAFANFLRKGYETDLLNLERKSLSVVSDPDGGYLVSPNITKTIFQSIYENSPMRNLANVIEVSSDAIEGVNYYGELATGWVGELDKRTETKTGEITKWRIPVHELYAEPRISQKLLDDSFYNLEEHLAKNTADMMSAAENLAFICGNSPGMPRGFTTYHTTTASDGTRNNATMQHVLTGKNGAFADENASDVLINLQYSLKTRYRQGAVWLMNRNTLSAVRKLKDKMGNYLWQPGLIAGMPANLLGFPVYEDENMPSISKGSLAIAFGNFKFGYTIIDRSDIRLLRDPYTSKPYVKFYMTKRVGGDVLDFDAIKFIKFE